MIACAAGSSAQTTITPAGNTYSAAPAFGGLSTSIAGNVLTITPSSRMNANATYNGMTFTSLVQNERGGLALVNGRVYVSYSGHAGDCGLYRIGDALRRTQRRGIGRRRLDVKDEG